MNPINVTASMIVCVLAGSAIGWTLKAMYDERKGTR